MNLSDRENLLDTNVDHFQAPRRPLPLSRGDDRSSTPRSGSALTGPLRSCWKQINNRRCMDVCIIFGVLVTVSIFYFGLFLVFKSELCNHEELGSASSAENSTTDGSMVPSQPKTLVVTHDCGGILHIPAQATGYIAYKNGSYYDNDERCAWIIKSDVQVVTVRFIQHEFNVTYGRIWDGIVSGELDHNYEEFSCHKWTMRDYTRPRSFVTPFVLYFTSDGGTTRRGFTIQLTPEPWTGTNEAPTRTFYVHKRKRGTLSLRAQNGAIENLGLFGLFQPSPPSRPNYCWKRNLTCGSLGRDLCRNSVALYEMEVYHDEGTCSLQHRFSLTGTTETVKAVVLLSWVPGEPLRTASSEILWHDLEIKKNYSDPQTSRC